MFLKRSFPYVRNYKNADKGTILFLINLTRAHYAKKKRHRMVTNLYLISLCRVFLESS